MNGRRALTSMLAVLPGFFEQFFAKADLTLADVAAVIPHQASPALSLAMRRLGIPREAYVDRVDEYGNMVSAPVPYTLIRISHPRQKSKAALRKDASRAKAIAT